ncbi:hypothetical protein AKJ16_DCAP07158 [Drosera capensis]
MFSENQLLSMQISFLMACRLLTVQDTALVDRTTPVKFNYCHLAKSTIQHTSNPPQQSEKQLIGCIDYEAEVDAFDIHYSVVLLNVYLESCVPIAIKRGLNAVGSTPSPLLSCHSALYNNDLGDIIIALDRLYDPRAGFAASFSEFSANQYWEFTCH